MVLTATIILVLTLLVYGFWRWLWHIALSLALALLLYETWPLLSQIHSDNAVVSLLTQIDVPQVSAANTQSGRPYDPHGRPYAIPQGTDGSRIHFAELGREQIPRPYPRPILCAKDRAGKDVFLWKGRRWYLPHNEEPYRYLCVPEEGLEWCWPIPPNASAVPCRSPDTGEKGWCWRSAVSYRDDS